MRLSLLAGFGDIDGIGRFTFMAKQEFMLVTIAGTRLAQLITPPTGGASLVALPRANEPLPDTRSLLKTGEDLASKGRRHRRDGWPHLHSPRPAKVARSTWFTGIGHVWDARECGVRGR